MSLTLEDEMGLLDAVMSSEAKKGFAHVIYASELSTPGRQIALLKRQRFVDLHCR